MSIVATINELKTLLDAAEQLAEGAKIQFSVSGQLHVRATVGADTLLDTTIAINDNALNS